MPAPHIADELLDHYALGAFPQELLAATEEHLLVCPHCQTRLVAADEFIGLFRAAATQPDARPGSLGQRWFRFRFLTWAGTAVALAAGLAVISLGVRNPHPMPVTVYMQTFRGPEAGTTITPDKPTRLVFDLPATGAPRDYEVQIVDPVGNQVLAAPADFTDGHISSLARKLKPGSYWVRIYRAANRELIAEYGLRAK